MNKSTILLLLALIASSLCLKIEHEQRYGPSNPGGTSSNYTKPYSQPNNYNNQYTQPKPNNYYNQQPQTGYNQPTPLINGQPYVYRGPFVLACWSRYDNQKPLYQDRCYDSNSCYNLLIKYNQCANAGNIVKKYQQ